MGNLGADILATSSVLAQPTNLAALLAGLLAGLLSAGLIVRADLDRVALLVLLFPIAALLDPATAMILLGSAWAALLVATSQPSRAWRLGTIALGLVLGVAVAIGPAAVLVPKLLPVEKVALLAITAALVVLAAAQAGARAWGGAFVLIATGLALELSPLQPLDTAKTSPRAVLLGLFVLGPTLVAIVRPRQLPADRVQQPPQHGETIESVGTVAALLLLAMPITVTGALLMLALGEHGLSPGETLLTQRPRLVLSMTCAVLAAAFVTTLVVAAMRKASLHALWPSTSSGLDAGLAARIGSGIVALLAVALLFLLGVEQAEYAPLAIAAAVGGALYGVGISSAPLLIGLTVGEVLRPALAPAARAGITDARAAAFVAIAALAIVVAIAWPWLARTRRAKLA